MTNESGDDIVEGEFLAPRRVAKTVGEAASEYFEWSEEREQRRKKRAQKLSGARSAALLSIKGSPPFDAQARSAVTQFVTQVTPDLPVAELTPHRVAAFQDAIGANAAARLLPVKEFLHFCWKARGYTDVNLGNHLLVKSARAAAATARGNRGHEESERFEMTAGALERLEAELSILQQQMPTAIGDRLEQIRAWADACETLINDAKVVDPVKTGRVCLGSTVGVRRPDAGGGQVQQYTLVGPTEVNAEQRRISIESPVGKGFDRRDGRRDRRNRGAARHDALGSRVRRGMIRRRAGPDRELALGAGGGGPHRRQGVE